MHNLSCCLNRFYGKINISELIILALRECDSTTFVLIKSPFELWEIARFVKEFQNRVNYDLTN